MELTQDYLHQYGLQKTFYPAEDAYKKILVGKVLLRKSYDSATPSLSHFVSSLGVKTSARYRSYLLELDLGSVSDKLSKKGREKAIDDLVISRLTQSLRTFIFNGVGERNRFEFEFKLMDFLERFERLSYAKNTVAVTALYKEFYDAVQTELRLGDTVLKEPATNAALNAEAPVDLFKEGMTKFYNDDDEYFKSTFEAHLTSRKASDVQTAVRSSKYASMLPNTEYDFKVTSETQRDRINAAFAAAKIHPRNLVFGTNNVRWYNYVHHAHGGDEEAATQALYNLLDGTATIEEMNSFRGYLPVTNIPLLRERFEVSDYDIYRSDFGTGMGPLEVINPTNLKHAWSHGNPVDEVRHNKYGQYLEEVREKRRARAMHPMEGGDEEDLTEEVDFGAEEPHRGMFKKLTAFTDPRLHYQHLFNRGEAEERKQKEELLAMLEEDEKTIEMMQRYNDQRAAALKRKNKLADLEAEDDHSSQATVVSDKPQASFKSRLHHTMRINSSSFGLKSAADVEVIDNINFDNSVNEILGTRTLSSEEAERVTWDMRFLLAVVNEKGAVARFANRVLLILYNNKLRILQVEMQEDFKEESLLSKLPYHEEVYKKEAERNRRISSKPSVAKSPSTKHSDMFAIEESSGDESSEESSDEDEENESDEEEASMVKPASFKKAEVKEKVLEKELVAKAKSTALVPAKKKKVRTGATSLNINIPNVVKSFDFNKIKSRFFEDEDGHLKIPYNGDVQKYVSYVIQFFKDKDWTGFKNNLMWFAKKIYSELEYYVGVLIRKAREIDFDYQKVIEIIKFYMMKAAVITKPLANYAIEVVKKVPRLVKSDEFRGGLLKVLNFLVLCIGELKKYSGDIVNLANAKSILYSAVGKVIEYSGPAIKSAMSGGTKLVTTAGKTGVMLLK